MKPTLVTGATGFLGKHLVELLLAQNEPLRLLCRGASPWDSRPGVEIVRGDITDERAVSAAVEGSRRIFHLAGVVSRDPKEAPKLYQVHVEGTRHLCEAALRHNAARIVAVSSSGTIAVSKDPAVHHERSPFQKELTKNWAYYASKIEAEELLLEYHHTRKLPVVIVNPALILGPGDDRNSSTGDLVALLQGQFLTYPTGGMSFIDVRDAAAATLAAMERGRVGERYLLGGANMTFKKLIQDACRIANRPTPWFTSSARVSLACAPLLRRLMPLIGRKFDIDDETIELSGHFWYVDAGKAARELGLQTRDPLETLRDTIADIRARGLA